MLLKQIKHFKAIIGNINIPFTFNLQPEIIKRKITMVLKEITKRKVMKIV